jgi:hypothetical protein
VYRRPWLPLGKGCTEGAFFLSTIASEASPHLAPLGKASQTIELVTQSSAAAVTEGAKLYLSLNHTGSF